MSTHEPGPLRVMVVDDESLARDGLVHDLISLESPKVEVVGAFADGFAACESIRLRTPDALFLDIEMPELNGFELLERLEPEELPPAIVFVTAYDEHALRSFEVRALDYLLKPYTLPRLHTAVVRAVQRVREANALRASLDREAVAMESDAASHRTSFVVGERERRVVLPVSAVEWIEAAAWYARLHALGASWLIRETMRNLEQSLDPTEFLRSHRSAIVRLDQVREIRALTRYEHAIHLASGGIAPLSAGRRPRLEALLIKP